VRLATLAVRDDPARWERAGFALDDAGRLTAGGVTITVAPGEPPGLAGWGVDGAGAVAGLPACPVTVDPGPAEHRNGTVALDHVVIATSDLPGTRAALAAAGLQPRRVREAGPVHQAFYVLETALAEVVGPAPGGRLPAFLSGASGPGEGARFWGLTFVVDDLDATAALLGDRVGPVAAAVQPGRRIATLRAPGGPAVPIAFMSPR
jgi:hypothetical protein